MQKYSENNLPNMSDPEIQNGTNKLSMCTLIFANQCGFNDPTRHKPHGKRALGITILSNSGTSEDLMLKVSRHVIVKMHARYQCLTSESIENNTK